MRLAVLLLAIAACSLQTVHGLQPVLLDLTSEGIQVTATTECGGSDGPTEYAVCSTGPDCVRTCGRGDGEIAHHAELAVDGDRSTSWQSPPLSFYQARGESIGSHNLTIDLGREVHVTEVEVYAGDGMLPATTELYLSVDGITFTQRASLDLPLSERKEVVIVVMNVTDGLVQLSSQQKAASHARYLKLSLLAPPTSIVTSDPRTGFYSVGEVSLQVVELEVCPVISPVDLECHGEPVTRRSVISLGDAALHRLLWQRSNQSDWWIMDHVTLLLEGCPVKEGGCERRGVREDFSGLPLNSVLWDFDSIPTSTIIGPRPCSNPRDPALLIPPGDQIISHSLPEATRGVIFDAEFPLLPPFCMGAEYSPVEVRLCRSIEGVLGECQLVRLVSRSECGNCLDQLTFQLRYLQESIDSALFPANLTVLDDLHSNIHTTLYQLEALEGLVLVLQVVFGSLSGLPPSAPPPPMMVPRLDLQLVPSILTKLQELQDLLGQMPSIVVVSRDDLVAIYADLRSRLGRLLTQGDILQSDQRALSVTVSLLLRSLSDIVDAISAARETANQITIVISGRQYLDIQTRVQTITNETVHALEMADRFVGLAQTNHQHVEEVRRLEAVLVKAANLAEEVVGRGNSSDGFVRQAQFVEQDIMSLLNEAEEVLRGVGVLLQEGEVAVATGDQLLSIARETYENASLTLPDVVSLMDQVNQTIQYYSFRLAGLVQDSPCKSGGDNCTRSEEHATDLETDHAFIVNSSVSVYTLRYANDTLTALESAGTPLDLTLINSTALSAQQTALGAIDQLAGISASLDSVTSIVLSAQQLRDMAVDSLAASTSLSEMINTSSERKGQLDIVLDEQQMELTNLNDRMEGVASRDGITDEALLLLSRANSSLEVVRSAEGRVEEVREGVREARGQLDQIVSNVRRAETTLQDSEQRFPLVSRLLTATRSQAETALFNVTDFIAENDRIVRDIDTLISRLSTVHASIGLINSPVRLSSEPAVSEAAVPYLSLQPPPGRQLGSGVQFDDLDLYMWPSAQYQTPSVLFYAGPVRFPDQQNRTQPETREDVVWVVAEEDQLRLGWELGSYRANTTYPTRVEGDSLLRLTRIGSQFQLQFTPSAGEGLLETTLVNNSLLFYSSERTAFLLGGWPQGAQLGSEDAPLPLSSLHGFEGQFQLALFNGDLWGLWNVRSTSDTDLIGDKEFRRNGLARNVAWHASAGQLRSSSAISFDGRGYLFTEQFGTVADFSSGAVFQTVMLFLRPNDASRGLAMYAYQTQESVSLEVFYRNGHLNVLISHHDDSSSTVLVNHTEVVSEDEEMEVSIRFILTSGRYVINGQLYSVTSNSRFFTDLQQVKAWFGGVHRDRLEGSYIPREMAGYFGCVDMYVLKNFDNLFEIFRGPSFTDYYLNSPVQSRLSATCYATVYVSEVSFVADSEGLAYTYLPLPPRSCVFNPFPLSHSLSLSLLPLEENGYILTTTDQNTTLSVVLRSGVVEVTVASGTESVSLTSQEPLELGAWHYLLLSLDLPNHPDAEFSLFLDGLLQEAVPSSLPEFSLALPTSAPVGVANPLPVLFVGGVPATYDPNARVANFEGCLKDLTFNLCPLSFQAPPLVERYPPGVSYHTCPASTVVSTPELPVRPAPPHQRVCLGVGPVELDFTHGGFARDTELRSSNVAGLLGSEWTLSFSLRQRSPGHVISVRSVSGESVKVEVAEGGHLLMTATCNSTLSMSPVMSPPLAHNIFTDVAIRCAVESSTFVCNMTVDSSVEVASVPVCAQGGEGTTLFDPALPITLGMMRDGQGDTVAGFEGCISDLTINGDKSGFQDVETGIPCYNKTLPGIGLTGTSRLSHLLPGPSNEVVIELSVRPLLESGVVMVLTEPVSSRLVLAIGLVRGVLRVSNSSGGFLTLAEGVCDPTNNVTFDLTVRYTESRISVGVAGSDVVVLSPPPSVPEIQQLLLTIGNAPEDLPSGESLFFLQSATMLPSTAPAGLAGCLVSGSLLGETLTPTSVDHTQNILNGFCPDA